MVDNMEIPVQVKIHVQEIVKIEFEVQNLVQSIRLCEGPLGVLNDLDLKVKQKMKSLRQKVEGLEQLASEQDKESDRLSILAAMQHHRKEMLSLQGSIRKANLASRALIDKSEKEELLGGKRSSIRQRNFSKENLAKTASNITQDLMSIARMMERQVKQNEADVQTLASSSAQIKGTHEEYRGLSSIIQISKNLLNKYNRREVTDRLLIFFGLVLFFSTVLYILKKRLPIFGG
ncbi:vesicle transport protein SEC20-like isoform X1 [Montipora capricornis]|uniref:vesicle transport protein SEC20-like isoform X1 n=1 Tax=Montipora capricornis TaxID=246305 RepID=UPI0035F176D6